jgi:hypothetical protein
VNAESAQPPLSKPKRKSLGCFIGLAVLAAFLFLSYCLVGWVMSNTIVNRVWVDMKMIPKALEAYKAEYGHWPSIPAARADEDAHCRSIGVLIECLLGEEDIQNPRKIRFIDFPLAKNDSSFGLVLGYAATATNPEPVKLLDLWGEPYFIILDTNNDGEIANPEAGRQTGWFNKLVAPATLQLPAIIYSSGPDRDPKTWHDNLCSWRSTEPVAKLRLSSIFRWSDDINLEHR